MRRLEVLLADGPYNMLSLEQRGTRITGRVENGTFDTRPPTLGPVAFGIGSLPSFTLRWTEKTGSTRHHYTMDAELSDGGLTATVSVDGQPAGAPERFASIATIN